MAYNTCMEILLERHKMECCVCLGEEKTAVNVCLPAASAGVAHRVCAACVVKLRKCPLCRGPLQVQPCYKFSSNGLLTLTRMAIYSAEGAGR